MAKYYAGMETDANCGRCKMETRHRVLSVTEGVPEKLMCVGCGSVHKFKPARVAEERPGKTEKAAKPTKATPRAASPSHFQSLMISEQAGAVAKPYGQGVAWETDMWLDHPAFGLGKIQHKSGRKLTVLFRDGVKLLMAL
jgi:hypothetical protein